MLPEADDSDAEQVLARFLSGRTERTRRACTADLEDFSRVLGRTPAGAAAELLAGPLRGKHAVLAYAVDLRRRGLAGSTVQRRLATGLVDVRRRGLDLRVGEWGGRVGSQMATDCRALFFRLGAAFEAAFGIAGHEYRELVTAMQLGWEQYHTTYRFVFAAGRKPD